LLAVESDSLMGSSHLEASIEREYHKQGAISPHRPRNGKR
jgi:hypothetical protein